MAITLVGKLDTTEGTHTIAYAQNIADDIFSHENMKNGNIDTENLNKQNKLNEFLYQRSIKPIVITCGTAADTAQKSIIVEGVGERQFTDYYPLLRVKFTHTNTAANPTLKVNTLSTKIYPIYYNGAAITSSNASVLSGTVLLMYDGSVSGSEHWDYITSDVLTTDTWREVYVDDVSKAGISINTKAINFKSGDNVTLTYSAPGEGDGESGSENYFNVEISAEDTTYTAGDEIVIDEENVISHVENLESVFHPTTSDTSISGFGGSGSFKVPVFEVNQYGHITSASEATMSISIPEDTIVNYDAPDYETTHVDADYISILVENTVEVDDSFETGINKVDNKLAGLHNETIKNDAVLAASIENDTRYYAKSESAANTSYKEATLVDDRYFSKLHGTHVDVYFTTANTASTPIYLNINDSGSHILIFNNIPFDGTLIENGTAISVVYDETYDNGAGCYRVVGGVKDTDTTYTVGNELTLNENNTILHDAKLGADFSSTTATTTISGDGGNFKVPIFNVNSYGHTTSASEATITINNTIDSYTTPSYLSDHFTASFINTVNNNTIQSGGYFGESINKVDNKLAALTEEVVEVEATIAQAVEDETRYYAKSTTAGNLATKTATLVEDRNFRLINGTHVNVFFLRKNTASGTIYLNVNSSGAKVVTHNNQLFDGSLIEAGITLQVVYDADDITINNSTYHGCYRVVGGVGTTDTTYTAGSELTLNETTFNHATKLPNGFTGTTQSATINSFGQSGIIKVPILSINTFGHVTSASEATISLTIPEAKITSYSAPEYPITHISREYVNIVNNNTITVNTTFERGINNLDNKLAGLTNEVVRVESTLTQAIEDETRYYAKSTTAGTNSLKIATLVDDRHFSLLNGTQVNVYFANEHTTSGVVLLSVNGSASTVLVYNDAIFDGTLIENGTTLELVYDDNVNITYNETTYTTCYRVVGGVGSGSSAVTTQVINVNNPIGSYSVGDTIAIGTDLEEIIRNMLMVTIDVTYVLPSFTWNGISETTVEVGQSITIGTTVTTTDGYYKSADETRYTPSDFNTINNTQNGRLPAGCTVNNLTISNSSITRLTSEGTKTYTPSMSYSAGTATPIKSDGITPSSNLITSGTLQNTGKTVSWKFKAFYGYTTYIPTDEGNQIYADTKYNTLTPPTIYKNSSTQGSNFVWCNIGNATTTVNSMISPSGHTSLVLFLPAGHENIINTTFFSSNVKDNWIIQKTLHNGNAKEYIYTFTDPVTSQTTSTIYYIYVIDNGAAGLEYTDIIFKNNN